MTNEMTFSAAARIARSAGCCMCLCGFPGRACKAAFRNEGASICCKLFKWLIIFSIIVIVCFYVYSYYENHSDINNFNKTNSIDWLVEVTDNVGNFLTSLEKKILPTNISDWSTKTTSNVGNFLTSLENKFFTTNNSDWSTEMTGNNSILLFLKFNSLEKKILP